jgi:hypothetical protein
MKRKAKFFTGVFAGALALMVMSSSAVLGQEKQVTIQRERGVPEPGGPDGPPPPDHTFMFVSSEMNFDGKLVKGAPYSGQAVTETTQTLGDGNRIVNKSTAAVFRDSEGRTRREQSLKAIGPFATAGEPSQSIFINDPVAGVNYALDSRTMVARKMSPMRFEFKYDPAHDGPKAGGGHAKGAPRIEVHPEVYTRHTGPPPPGGAGGAGGNMVIQWHGGPEKRGKTESLGKQTIEGVEAEGTRNVTTIPAGEIGNERAIEIVFERWYSAELQAVVMTRHADPRFGETSYRLTNISRGEQARSLFEVPSGYTIKEGAGPSGMGVRTGMGGPPHQIRVRKPAPNHPE